MCTTLITSLRRLDSRSSVILLNRLRRGDYDGVLSRNDPAPRMTSLAEGPYPWENPLLGNGLRLALSHDRLQNPGTVASMQECGGVPLVPCSARDTPTVPRPQTSAFGFDQPAQSLNTPYISSLQAQSWM